MELNVGLLDVKFEAGLTPEQIEDVLEINIDGGAKTYNTYIFKGEEWTLATFRLLHGLPLNLPIGVSLETAVEEVISQGWIEILQGCDTSLTHLFSR